MSVDRAHAEQDLDAAEVALENAQEAADRAGRIEAILQRQGLAYGSVGGGDYYVAYDGVHLGYVRRAEGDDSALLHWFGYPADGSTTSGPHGTARAAAAALWRQDSGATRGVPGDLLTS